MKIRELLIELKAETDPLTKDKYVALIGLKALQEVRPELEVEEKAVLLQPLFHKPYLTSVLDPSNQNTTKDGVCVYLTRVSENLVNKILTQGFEDYLNQTFKHYPNYSGNPQYPIRCEQAEKNERWSAEEAADQGYWITHLTNANFYGPNLYGQERWKFINWFAEVLENELSIIQKQAIPVLPNQLDITD